MSWLDEERKRLLQGNSSQQSANGVLPFLDRERIRLTTGVELSPAAKAKITQQEARDKKVEKAIPNIGDPLAALRNLPTQIQQGIAGPEPGPGATQEEMDAWATKKVKEDYAKIQAEKNAKASGAKAPAPAAPQQQRNGFFDTLKNLVNPDSYNQNNVSKNLSSPSMTPVREGLGFAQNVVDSATLGALPYAFDKARNIPGSQYLLNSQANTTVTNRAAQQQKGTGLGTTAELLGTIAPYAGAYKATAGLARTMNAGRGPIASNFVRGTLAGGAYGAANEVGEQAFGKNEQHWTERLSDVGASALLGGAGDAAISAALPLLGRVANKYLPGFRSTPDAPTPADTLALPLGQRDVRMSAAAQRGVNAPGTDPIVEPYTFGLPDATPNTTGARSKAVDDVGRVANDQQLLDSRRGARINQEYQQLKAQALSQSQAGQAAPSNRELYEMAKQRVDTIIPNGSNQQRQSLDATERLDSGQLVTDAPLVENRLRDNRLAGRQLPERQGIQEDVIPPEVQSQAPDRSFAPEAPPARRGYTVDDYQRALETGDIETMRKMAPDIADKMAAYPGDFSQIPSFLRGKMYTALGVNKRPPSNLLRESDLAPAVNRTPEPKINAEMGPQPRNMADQNVNPLVANADVSLGPEVNQGGVGIIPGQSRGLDPYVSPLDDTRSQLRSRASINTQDALDPSFYRAAADRLHQNFIDDLSPIQKKIDRTIERITGKPLDSSESPYKMALAGRGADMTARQIVTTGMLDAKGEVIGKSLKEVLAPIRTQRENVLFEDYLLNRHAITRAERGEKVFANRVNWTPQDGANKIAAYDRDYPAFQQAADDLYTFQRQLVENHLVDGGLISREEARAWFDANPFYVPNKRYFSSLEKGNGGFGGSRKGVANPSNPVKAYKKGDPLGVSAESATAGDIAGLTGGSQRQIISPIEAIIENVDAYVKVAQRNKTMQQMYKYITTNPDDFADFATIVRKDGEQLPKDDIEALVSDLGRDYDKGLQKFNMTGDNIVRLQLNGNTVRMQINDKPFLEAITAMGPQGSGFLLEAVGSVTNFFKKYTTGSNPFFAFTRNLPRDFVQGYVSSTTTNNPFRYFTDYVKSIADIAMDGPNYQAFKNVGGGHSSSVSADRNLLAQSKRQLVGKKGPLNKLGRINDAYDNVMNAVESAPRLGEFRRTLEAGGTKKEGLYKASDVTVNFKRKGRIARDIDKVFPYFNAAMQGMDQLARLYANPATRGKAVAKAVVSLSVPTALLYLMNKDDPDYQKLTDRQKDAYFNLPKEDGTFWKVAKPQELGTIFSDVIERGMRALDGEGNEAFRDFTERLRATMTPPGVGGLFRNTDISDRLLGDTILAPFTQLGANKNFAGSPIVPGYLERLSPELQKDAKTSKLGELLAGAPVLGKIADNSPKKADFLIKAYTGWIGQFGTAATSPGVGLGKALEQQVSVDPTFSNDISNEFYDYKTKLDQAYADREQRELPEWYDDGARTYLNSISTQMSDIRGLMRGVQDDQTLSNKDKTDQLREMQGWVNELGEEANAAVREYIPRK